MSTVVAAPPRSRGFETRHPARRSAPDWIDAPQPSPLIAGFAGSPRGGSLVFERMPFPRSPATERPTQWGYVANSYVVADHRNAGLGSSLINACTSHADEQGFARLVLSPSERSVPFYTRAGFEPATSLMVRPGPTA